MEPLLVSTVLVAIAEIGDKSQLLTLLVAARYREPWRVLAGIAIAALGLNTIAAVAGNLLADLIDERAMAWVLAVSFGAMAVWSLVPEKEEEEEAPSEKALRFGPFLASALAFFVLEMGDKTQVATVALGARFDELPLVILGTTLGMGIANLPVALLGEYAVRKVPLQVMRGATALLFLALGLGSLAHALGWF